MAGVGLIEGDRELQRILKRLRTTAARRVVARGSVLAGRALAKQLKQEIPSRYKGIRRALGSRPLKTREAPDGGAKIGAAVGKTSSKYARGPKPGKRGIGMGSNTIQWWFLGTYKTAARFTGKRGGPVRFTGTMEPQADPVIATAKRNQAKMVSEFQKGFKERLAKEIAQGKAYK